MNDIERDRDRLARQLAEALRENSLLRDALAASQVARLAAERERNEALHELAHARFQLDLQRARLDHTRTGVAGVVAELRQLALVNRRDACSLSQPYCFGPTRAAEAFEQAVALLDQALGGES